MPIYIKIIFLLVLFPQLLHGQSFAFPLLRSIDQSPASIFNNPAGLATQKEKGLLIKHENPFRISALQRHSIGAFFPVKSNVFSFLFTQFGTSDYLLQYATTGLSRSFGMYSGAFRFTYRREFINDGLDTKHHWMFEAGLMIAFSKNGVAGFHIKHPDSVTEINEKQKVSIGFQYKISTQCKLGSELEKENQSPIRHKLGLEYQYHKKLVLLFNIQSGLQRYQLGHAFSFYRFVCQINTSWHKHLGIGFQYVLSYQL